MEIHEATAADRPAVANVLDAANLAVDDAVLERATILAAYESDRQTTAGARAAPGNSDSHTADGVPLGVLVLDEDEIAAVAVRRRRRGQGIGSTLVEAAADRRPRLEARFDPDVRPFYESLGFAIECGRQRCHGIREPDTSVE